MTAVLQEDPGHRWPQQQVAMQCAHAAHACLVMSRPLSRSVCGETFFSLTSCCFAPQRSHHYSHRTCSSKNDKTLAQLRRFLATQASQAQQPPWVPTAWGSTTNCSTSLLTCRHHRRSPQSHRHRTGSRSPSDRHRRRSEPHWRRSHRSRSREHRYWRRDLMCSTRHRDRSRSTRHKRAGQNSAEDLICNCRQQEENRSSKTVA